MLEKKKPNVPLLLKDCIYLYASLSPSFPSFFFFIHILCIWLAFYLISELFRAKYDLSYSKDISTITYKYLFLSLDKHLKMKFKKIKIRFWLLSGFNHRQVWTNFHPWFVSLFSSSSASFSFFFWYNFYFKEWVTNPSCSGIMYSFLGFFLCQLNLILKEFIDWWINSILWTIERRGRKWVVADVWGKLGTRCQLAMFLF